MILNLLKLVLIWKKVLTESEEEKLRKVLLPGTKFIFSDLKLS